MRRIILISLGCTALVLGGIGIVVPIMPTTPFVLCAAGCFSASSPRLYAKIANTRYFGEYVRNYRDKTGISTQARVLGLVFLWAALLISALLIQKPVMLAVFAAVGAAVSIHILTIRRAKRKDDPEGQGAPSRPDNIRADLPGKRSG